ncbi:MAG TPA: hypothetical protein VFO66_10745 [Gemmatimonadaceae bacterium]|nr:hypothetical protein [Gemmatimonadaceae bacterium]
MSEQDTVASLSELYLGNILFALETTAMELETQGQADNAAFYRGIARKLAEAHGRASRRPPPSA